MVEPLPTGLSMGSATGAERIPVTQIQPDGNRKRYWFTLTMLKNWLLGQSDFAASVANATAAAVSSYFAAHPVPTPTNGLDGKSVELQKTATAVQWRQAGGAWVDLVPLSAITGAAGTPKRVERYTATTNSSGIATITFSPAFSAVPDVDPVIGWATDQMIAGAVTSVSTTGCTVQVMVSKGTLLLTAGPFQKAAAGVSVTVRAIG